MFGVVLFTHPLHNNMKYLPSHKQRTYPYSPMHTCVYTVYAKTCWIDIRWQAEHHQPKWFFPLHRVFHVCTWCSSLFFFCFFSVFFSLLIWLTAWECVMSASDSNWCLVIVWFTDPSTTTTTTNACGKYTSHYLWFELYNNPQPEIERGSEKKRSVWCGSESSIKWIRFMFGAISFLVSAIKFCLWLMPSA